MTAAATAAGAARRTVRRPLLEGRAAARAWEAIEAIAREIPPPREDDGTSPDLARGHAGRALFFAYVGAARGEAADRSRALAHLDAAAEGLARVPLGVGLLGGFTGVAWTLRHLAAGPLAGEPMAEDATAEIDDALLGGLDSDAWNIHYELAEGLAGIAIYALEGLAPVASPPAPGADSSADGARRLLERVVDRLEATAEPRERGMSWFTPPELLPAHQRAAAPEGYYNCGVAHGVPAALVALARCRAAGVEPRRAGALAAAAAEWLLAQRQAPAVGSEFPGWIGAGTDAHATRLAWCYGDPGVAAALAVAAAESGRRDWRRAAAEVGLRAAARSPEGSGIEDAGLCHGAAGLGHLLHRLYRATGEPALAAAAARWLEQALEMREPGLGVGGYRAWEPSLGGWHDDAGLLVGAAGVGLALLAAVTPAGAQAAEWDRVLACSG
jgi:hypothetical protein